MLVSQKLFYQCAIMVWLANCSSNHLKSILHLFYRQNISMTLQKVQAITILKWIVLAKETSFRLDVFSIFSPFSLFLICFTWPTRIWSPRLLFWNPLWQVLITLFNFYWCICVFGCYVLIRCWPSSFSLPSFSSKNFPFASWIGICSLIKFGKVLSIYVMIYMLFLIS